MDVPHIRVSKHYTDNGCYADITLVLIIRDSDIETTIEDFVNSLKPQEASDMNLAVEENTEINTPEGHTAYNVYFPRIECEQKENVDIPILVSHGGRR